MNNAGIIFDMDGVLVDSREYHHRAFRRLGEEIGVPFPEELFVQTFGQANPTILRRWLGDDLDSERIRELGDRKERLYRDLAAAELEPLPGVDPLLRRLVRAGFRLAIGSSGPRENVEMILDRFGWRDLFSATVCKDDVAEGKPDPAVFLEAGRRLGADPSRCIVVEDAVPGIEAAHRAGMRCIAVSTTRPRHALSAAERVVDRMDALGPEDFRRLLDGSGDPRAERRRQP